MPITRDMSEDQTQGESNESAEAETPRRRRVLPYVLVIVLIAVVCIVATQIGGNNSQHHPSDFQSAIQ